ncbi:MAG: hypothetical protein ACLFV5_04925 [Anaerolineales bacterium]
MRSENARGPVWIDANPPSFLHAYLENVDPILRARKGALHLLCDAGITEAIAATVYDAYYSDPCFDTLPSLHSALSKTCLEHENVQGTLLGAVIIRDMSVFALVPEDLSLWLTRFGEVRELHKGPKRFPLTTAHEETTDYRTVLRAIRYPLGTGDRLLFTTEKAVEKLGPRKLRRLLRNSGSAQTLVRAMGRHGRPAAVIHVPGFSAVPAIESMSANTSPEPERTLTTPRARKRGISPIWPALLIAILSVVLAFWLKKPTISRQELSDIFSWALTPAANIVVSPTPPSTPGRTITPASETARSAAIPQDEESASTATTTTEYAPIELLYPAEDESVYGRELTLTWAWDGELKEDEYFDLRLWRLGEPEKSIAWTREREYTQRLTEPGWHSWRVCLVRRAEGVVEQVLAEAQAADFDWNPDRNE